MLLLGKIGIGLVGTALVGGAIASSDGFIHVKVHEKEPNGTHISLIVPAIIAPMAVRFVPQHDLKDASANVQQYLPIIDAAISGLAECPDGPLVEVVDSDSHVTVVKSGGSIVVDADDSDNTVHVAVPLRAAKSTIDEIAEANGPS
jgi:hypothetical protein